MTTSGQVLKTAPHFHLHAFRSQRQGRHIIMQAAKTSTFSVESLISKESFESRADGHGCISLPRGSLGPEKTRTSPSFTSSITLPRPLTLDGVSAGHTSAFSQTSQSPLSSARTFAISPRSTDHHPGKTDYCFIYCSVGNFFNLPTEISSDSPIVQELFPFDCHLFQNLLFLNVK